jgi:anti-anti-sigma regulatory factor
MPTPAERHLVCESPAPGVRVVRFTHPDLREQLYAQGAVTESPLFQELQAAALTNLTEGETVILNFGLVDPFPTAFYNLLLEVRRAVQERKARLLLCCLTPNIRECFDIIGGSRVFEVRGSEVRALSDVVK